MLKKYERGVITYKHTSLISRCKHICDSEQIFLLGISLYLTALMKINARRK